ncbi:MAG: hypothetical protein ACK4K0_00975 [Flavobacteriales bacterium]
MFVQSDLLKKAVILGMIWKSKSEIPHYGYFPGLIDSAEQQIIDKIEFESPV